MLNFFSAQQILLVHNGSQESNIGYLKKKFSTIHHLILLSNQGYSGGVNAGLNWWLQQKKSSTTHGTENVGQRISWIFLITNDCELYEWKLAPNSLAEKYHTLIAPLILFRSGKKVDSYGGHYSLLTGQLRHSKVVTSSADVSYLLDETSSLSYVPGSAFLVHLKILEKAGGICEDLHTYWEDVLWSQKIKKSGFLLGKTKNIVIKHGGGKTTHHLPFYSFYLFQRNRLAFGLAYMKGLRKIYFAFSWILQNFAISLRWYKKGKKEYFFYLCKMLSTYHLTKKFIHEYNNRISNKA